MTVSVALLSFTESGPDEIVNVPGSTTRFMAEEALTLLLARIRAHRSAETDRLEEQVLDHELIVRESSAPPKGAQTTPSGRASVSGRRGGATTSNPGLR